MKPSSTAEYKRARRHQLRKEFWGLPVPEGMKHGRSTVAQECYGCECSVCLPSGRRRNWGNPASKAERARRLRASKKGKPVPPGTKHGVYAYRTYGCHCDFCVLANRRSRAKSRHAWQENTTGVWSTRGRDDVIHWPPVGEGTWTCPECGEQFQRRGKFDAQAAA